MDKLSTILVGGDFNSNCCWDKKNKRRTHAAVVQQLADWGLSSCYHEITHEHQGHESQPTFYHYRNKDKFYHIDYFFYNKDKIKAFDIGQFHDWISLSDHMPVLLDIDDF